MKYTMNLIRTLALMAAGLLPLAVQAQPARDDCTRNPALGGDLHIRLPVTINIGSATPVGEPIGPWFSQTVTWTCTRVIDGGSDFPKRTNDQFKVRTNIKPAHTLVDTGNTIAVDGMTYTVYRKLGVDVMGGHTVGVILRVTQAIDGGVEKVQALNGAPAIILTNDFAHGPHRAVNAVSTFRLKLQARFVKLANTATVTGADIKVLEFNFHTSNKNLAGADYWEIRNTVRYINMQTTIQSTAATCELINGNTIADRTVQLRSAYTHRLRTDGFGPSTAFDLHFRQCPPGMSAIQYEFQPLPQGTTVTNGILPQQATGPTAASGVGVQVLDENGLAVPFHQALPLATYNPNASAPANYTLPLKARIVHTGDPLNGGEVEAAMKVSVTYK